ncbi:MAG: response regulator [Lachnospiraceae bacterium]|nr:response regulator [Lachnospiraceae bacterium]
MYKTQVACAIFILYIGILYFWSAGKKTESSKWFVALLSCSFFQLIFDACSVYTVNHLETVSPILNRVIHIIFLGLLQVMFYLAYRYLEIIIEEEIGRKIRKYRFSIIPLLLTMAGNIFLPVYYVESARSNYSYGPSVYMTYIGVAVYVLFIIFLMVRYRKQIPQKKKRAIYVALWSEIPVAVYQIMIPDSLITCVGIVLFITGIYMTTENPDAVLAEQLEKEKRRADSANAAKTNFLANMSHEIRTPINAVLGMNELIMRESKEADIKKYALNVDRAAKSLLSIINDILDITKIEAGKLKVISAEYSVESVLRDVITMISFKANVKDLAFKVQVDENIPAMLMGDDIRLRQILVNLLNNAVKYTQKGSVTLKVTMLPVEGDKARIRFLVKDTGIGIKEEDMEKLCAPFERIEEKRNRNIEGTGLGMSITKQLLELLNSRLEINSVYGEGSEFAFELCQEIVDSTPIGPMEETKLEEASEYRQSFEAPEAGILVVDDNELNRKVFAGLLKATRVQIDEACGGRECLSKVQEKKYDIIFLDHMMPDMDGMETLHAMKELGEFPSKEAPVVILTANAIVGAREKYLEEGFDAFLAKPIDYKKLEALVAELLDESLVQVVSVPGDYRAESVENSELPSIEGLDWNYAGQHFQDTESMLETVRFFADSLEFEAQTLFVLSTDIATEEGRKAYCTKVHSMKNSAATIGIIPLAGMAKVLEDAARGGEVEVLQSVTPVFLSTWRSYGDKLAAVVKRNAGKKNAKEHKEEIDSLLVQVRTAAEDMDIDALDLLWKQLAEFECEGELAEFMDRIHKAIVEFDVDYLQEAVQNKK